MVTKHFFNRAQFPTTGATGILYADDSTGQWFFWFNNGYTMWQPPLSYQRPDAYQGVKP